MISHILVLCALVFLICDLFAHFDMFEGPLPKSTGFQEAFWLLCVLNSFQEMVSCFNVQK